MKLERLGPSMTVCTFADGTQVLYSYETPCAVHAGGSYIQTDKYFSRTTSGHISKWLAGAHASVVKHDEIIKIAEGGR
jgi:hypothetical protein